MPHNSLRQYIRFQTILLTVLSILISIFTPLGVNALTISQQGQKTISAIVEGPPPSTPPTIDSPSFGLNFDNKNIVVSGSCITSLVVKVFSNNVFVGSAVCQSGVYSMQIDLFVDRNNLIARQYDSLDQPSPDSSTVTVYYIPPTTAPALPGRSSSSDQSQLGAQSNFLLYINYDYTVLGVFPGQVFRLPITFGGGTPPYAVGVDWGDGTNNIYSRADSSKFYAEHVYKKPGLYTAKLKVSDKYSEVAYLQFVVEVKGKTDTLIQQIIGDGNSVSILPVVVIMLIIFLSFYAGVKYQTKKSHKDKKHTK